MDSYTENEGNISLCTSNQVSIKKTADEGIYTTKTSLKGYAHKKRTPHIVVYLNHTQENKPRQIFIQRGSAGAPARQCASSALERRSAGAPKRRSARNAGAPQPPRQPARIQPASQIQQAAQQAIQPAIQPRTETACQTNQLPSNEPPADQPFNNLPLIHKPNKLFTFISICYTKYCRHGSI